MSLFNRNKLWAVLLALVLTAGQSLPVIAAAPAVYDFRLVQGQARLPSVSVYAEIVGAGEIPAKGVSPADFKVALGPAPGTVKRIVPFEDSGEGIGYVLLVDISKSLSSVQFLRMKETLGVFLDAMSKEDQAALVIFGSKVDIVQEFTPNRSKIKEKLAVLQRTDDETAFYSGIDKGLAVAKSNSEGVPRRRVLITLTDGVNDINGGVGKSDIADRLAKDPVPLYLIGFVQGKPTESEESAIGVMKEFAGNSGGRYYDGRGGDWRGIYFAITRAIRSAFLIEIEAPNFRSEGNDYSLEVSLKAANREWKEKILLTVPVGGTIISAGSSANPDLKKTDRKDEVTGGLWLYVGIAAFLFLAGGGWILRRRRSATPLAPVVSQAALAPASRCGVLVKLTRIQEGISPNRIELEIADRVILGSDPRVSNLIFDQDLLIAPAHCEIVFTEGRLFIRDLGTAQGTFVNGTAINSRYCIEEQDVLRLGDTEMRITFPA